MVCTDQYVQKGSNVLQSYRQQLKSVLPTKISWFQVLEVEISGAIGPRKIELTQMYFNTIEPHLETPFIMHVDFFYT